LPAPPQLGLDYFVGPELEFFLFKPHGDGSLLPLQPHDDASYFDISTDLAHSVRRQMVDALQAMGIDVEASHHEVAHGQSEIDFRYGPALATADNASTFRTTLKAVAQKNGLHCTFMPKPLAGVAVRACMSIRACGAATTATPRCTTPRATMA
jgi:glutamine synthetase